jgi:hypothetical protein
MTDNDKSDGGVPEMTEWLQRRIVILQVRIANGDGRVYRWQNSERKKLQRQLDEYEEKLEKINSQNPPCTPDENGV